MPVFTSKSDEKVAVGRKQVVAKTLRHLNPECVVLGKTGEAGKEFAKNVNRSRNTQKLRESTVLCEASGCWTGYAGSFAQGVDVPANVAAKVSSNISAAEAKRAADKKEGKAAKKPAKASKNAKAGSVAAKAKAARKRVRKPAPAAKVETPVEQPQEAAA